MSLSEAHTHKYGKREREGLRQFAKSQINYLIPQGQSGTLRSFAGKEMKEARVRETSSWDEKEKPWCLQCVPRSPNARSKPA